MSNAYDLLAQLYPANTTEAELYEVPASTEFQGDLNICNQTSSSVTYRVALLMASGSATDAQWIVYDKIITANAVHQITGLVLGAARAINIKVGTANSISFNLWGLEITA